MQHSIEKVNDTIILCKDGISCFGTKSAKHETYRKMTKKCVKELADLLIYSRFTTTCFGK
jgi:hypothetical protein